MIAYAITNALDNLDTIAQKATMVVYRDKTTPHYAQNAKLFLHKANEYAFDRVLLHQDYTLAHTLHANGIHLSSSQIEEIPKAKALGLFVVVSTHNHNEALLAQELGADMITYSPIFETPNKGTPIGLGALKELQGIISLPIIALGGIITKEQIEACKHSGASGFASIRYFN